MSAMNQIEALAVHWRGDEGRCGSSDRAWPAARWPYASWPSRWSAAAGRCGEDEARIVASALINNSRFAVLADRTTTGSPAQWGEDVVRCHDEDPTQARRSLLKRKDAREW